jgi:hypothetical protein
MGLIVLHGLDAQIRLVGMRTKRKIAERTLEELEGPGVSMDERRVC